MFRLVLGEVLVVFLNRFTADGKDPGQDCENLHVQIQMQLSEKRKIFFQLSVTFPESTSNLNIFKKRKVVIANVFPKLETMKIFLRPLSK